MEKTKKINYDSRCYADHSTSMGFFFKAGTYVLKEKISTATHKERNMKLNRKIPYKLYPKEFISIYSVLQGQYSTKGFSSDTRLLGKSYAKASAILNKNLANVPIAQWDTVNVFKSLVKTQHELVRYESVPSGIRTKPLTIASLGTPIYDRKFRKSLSYNHKKIYKCLTKFIKHNMESIKHTKYYSDTIYNKNAEIVWNESIVALENLYKQKDVNNKYEKEWHKILKNFFDSTSKEHSIKGNQVHDFIIEYFDVLLSPKDSELENKMMHEIKTIKTIANYDILEAAAYAHMMIVKHHIFNDANGRSARLMMNYILSQGGFKKAYFMSYTYKKIVQDSLKQNDISLFKNYILDTICTSSFFDHKKLNNCTQEMILLFQSPKIFNKEIAYDKSKKCINEFKYSIEDKLYSDSKEALTGCNNNIFELSSSTEYDVCIE